MFDGATLPSIPSKRRDSDRSSSVGSMYNDTADRNIIQESPRTISEPCRRKEILILSVNPFLGTDSGVDLARILPGRRSTRGLMVKPSAKMRIADAGERHGMIRSTKRTKW